MCPCSLVATHVLAAQLQQLTPSVLPLVRLGVVVHDFDGDAMQIG